MKTAKLLGFVGALLVAALVGGTMISAALAESPATSPSASPAAGSAAQGTYCEVFRSKLADELNVSESALQSAAKAAAAGTLDEAVKNGDLSQDAAAKIKQRLSSAAERPCFALAPRAKALHRGFARGFAAGDLLSAAAAALDMQPADLAAQLRSGDSLKDVAASKSVDYSSVTSAVMDEAKAGLDTAVDAGKITQPREERLLARLQAALDKGEWPRWAQELTGR
jgi:ribosomal protein S20